MSFALNLARYKRLPLDGLGMTDIVDHTDRGCVGDYDLGLGWRVIASRRSDGGLCSVYYHVGDDHRIRMALRRQAYDFLD